MDCMAGGSVRQHWAALTKNAPPRGCKAGQVIRRFMSLEPTYLRADADTVPIPSTKSAPQLPRYFGLNVAAVTTGPILRWEGSVR